MKSGITRRWFTGSLALTVLILLVAEGFFLYSMRGGYYQSVQQSMENQVSAIMGQLQLYTGEESANQRSLALRRMVEQYSQKAQFEFMLLDVYGNVISSSSGTDAKGIVSAVDFDNAQTTGTGIARYRTASAESVMSLCTMIPYGAQDIAAVRFVTSLVLVDAQVEELFWVSLLVVLIALAFSVFSGVYFIRSIVQPLGQVETVATAIARGDLSNRLPQTTNINDEVNRLCISINHMAKGLAETEQMKREFISSVSHELRTPLTSIKGWVETIQNIADPTDNNYRKGLSIINTETDRLYAMVEELLDFSRLQNGSFKVERQLLDLVAELTDAVIFIEARVVQDGLVLAYEEPEMLIPVFADPNRLRQVFLNILDNAVKYSAFGGKITVKIWQGKTKAFVEIIDQGKGISPEELSQVKTKFFKAKNAVRGSGIGLALVEEIMTALDGTIELRSTLGKGTVVTLGLPLYRKESGAV